MTTINGVIPVVLIHRGMADYVRVAIQQALKENDVILLGDTDPKIEHPNFKFHYLSDYSGGVDTFGSFYQHLNTTPPDYELFCYERWFYLRNFMYDKSIPVVFYIDSDVLLFCDVTFEWKNWSQYTMTLLHRTAAVSSYMTRKGLSDFVDMLQWIYSNKDSYEFQKIKSHFDVRQKFGLPGGVCDMTLFEWFHYHAEAGGGPGRVGEMMQIIDGCTFDHNINAQDQDFVMNSLGQKKIFIVRNKPICNRLSGDNVWFKSLHFQGDAKRYMKDCYELCNK